MLRKVSITLGMVLGIAVAQAGQAQAQCPDGNCGGSVGGYTPAGYGYVDSFGNMVGRGTQPLFDNYFTRGYANQAEAGMYISPVGVPGWVGHTYNTYQPLNPHQFLYAHSDRYHSYYDDGRGLNRTHASYYSPPVRTMGKKVYKRIELPR